MAFIDHKTKTVNFKIVYHGPGLAGKTTNMYYIYDMAKPDTKGKLMSLATETDRAFFLIFHLMECLKFVVMK